MSFIKSVQQKKNPSVKLARFKKVLIVYFCCTCLMSEY